MIIPARRTQQVRPFRVMDVISRAAALERQGRDLCHLEVGEPDFATAPAIIEAGRQALASGHTGYTEAAGLPALRERIAEWYRQRHGVTVDPGRIFVTPGASGGLNLAAQLLHNPGDGVLLPDPGYPCNRNFLALAGADPQLVRLDPGAGWALTPKELELARRDNSRALWLASPANPTGAVMDRPALQRVVEWCSQHGITILSDEIYHGLEFGERPASILEVESGALVVNSFSKYFGMTGWRIGWLVVPECLIEATNRLAQNLFISAPTVAQHAALRALDEDVREVLEERRSAFRQRRDFLAAELPGLGFELPSTGQGAFYLYAGLGHAGEHSEGFCQRVLDGKGVALTPGTDFSTFTGADHVRFAFTTGMERLEMAVERLRGAL
ncbi:MAG: aminotransferase class I/II-fold pyridoxal phosphate-dependent enzyme [Pseudohongiellaceae bacterium]